MRFLNKIIFINSAHVPYAEIKLDGNVHFIGTQGVGKSTLLRAILFFYNVDKSKLGIRTQDKQKGYDEFYFPYPNSYIIYEVCRENGTFFVMTFASNGRVAFRIVDCAYEKRFFLEEDNNVRYEWGRISEQIGPKVFRSNIIRGYEEFRDIIYGNVQNVQKELRRFNLMESSRYHNVPRTIQNIFLNQSLESRVIKDTIINSMDFADDSIDLNLYRDEVKNFRQQYEDIWKWYKKEKNGKVKVVVEAENVISRYSLYEVTKNAIKELCGKLNYAYDRDTEKVPQVQSLVETKSDELSRLKRLLQEEKGKYTKERDELKGTLAVLNNFLKLVRTKKQHFAEIDIDAIIERMSREKELLIKKNSLTQEEQTLTNENQSVKSKYDVLLQKIDNSLKEYSLLVGQKINEIDRNETQSLNSIQSEFNAKKDEQNEIFHRKMNDIQERREILNNEKNDLRLQRNKILVFNPFQKEMDNLTLQIHEEEKKKYDITLNLNAKKQEVTRITNDTEFKRKDLENACEKDLIAIRHAKDSLLQEVSQLEELLARQKDSLIEWLSNNEPNWEGTIGKVVDNEVLYNTSLEPVKVDKSDTLFGIRLELQNIDKKVNTPEEIRTKKETIDAQIQQLEKQGVDRKQQLELEIQELERIPKSKLKALRVEIINIEAELKQIPFRIDQYNKKKSAFEEKLVEWRKTELQSIDQQLREKEEQLSKVQDAKQEITSHNQKELEKLLKAFEKQNKEIKTQSSQAKEQVKHEEEEHKRVATARRRELEAEMDAELKGLGVDVARLSAIRSELQQVTEILKLIDDHRKDYYEWEQAKTEYFNQETSKKDERKSLEIKLNELQEKFELRRVKKDNDIRALSNNIENLQSELRFLNEGLEKVNIFRHNSTCPLELSTVGKKETLDILSSILDELRDTINSQQQRMEEFKKAVNTFKCNFSPQNTFHFRTDFNVETDYTEFASELNEFISNKIIEEYRTRTSNQYAIIIKRIARQVGDLNNHNADIKSTINDINRDFKENNFAGVIKDIELRAVESSDRLMQQLLNIKHFDDEFGFDIGQLNLFSNEQNQNKINQQAINLLMSLIDLLDVEKKRESITLSDTFKLEFKVKENDNDTNWVEKLSNVGSDGTDILVKSMVNIMLINVFKRKISKQFGDFKLHCMMDEIGKLHPDNVEGILKFANVRNIYLINSSPTTYNAQVYKYTYSLSKDERSNTQVKTLLTIR